MQQKFLWYSFANSIILTHTYTLKQKIYICSFISNQQKNVSLTDKLNKSIL